MSKQLVTLKPGVTFTDAGGGACFGGETISVDAEAAERLVARGLATRPGGAAQPAAEKVSPDGAVENRQTKPVIPDDLQGSAKIKWLREEITARGHAPEGSTIAGLETQLRAILSGQQHGPDDDGDDGDDG